MKCKDLAAEYEVSPMQVGRMRKKFFPDHKGGDLSDEEIDVLTEYYEELTSLETRNEIEESIKPVFVDGQISYVKEGYRRAEVFIPSQSRRVIAILPYKATKQMERKFIKLEEIEYNGEKFYRDATLAGRAWAK